MNRGTENKKSRVLLSGPRLFRPVSDPSAAAATANDANGLAPYFPLGSRKLLFSLARTP